MRAADSADRKVNITFGFQQRYGGVYVKAKQMLESGAIGKVREVHGGIPEIRLERRRTHSAAAAQREEKLEQWKLWRSTFGEVIVETYVHNLDAINWFLGAHPLKAIGTGGRTVEKRGDLLDHLSVTYDYPGQSPDDLHRLADDAEVSSVRTRNVHRRERLHRDRARILDVQHRRRPRDGKVAAATSRSTPCSEFVRRVSEGKPENVGVRAAESTLTSILGQMAIDEKREVTWDEMMRSA